jgi:hypothetical protein
MMLFWLWEGKPPQLSLQFSRANVLRAEFNT